MCGRYYIDDETAREIEKLVREAEEKTMPYPAASALKKPVFAGTRMGMMESVTDVCPSQRAWVLSRREKQQMVPQKEPWGDGSLGQELLGKEIQGQSAFRNGSLRSESPMQIARMQWGFPGFDKKGLMINARAESVLEKQTFRESVLHRRCVIPAKGFYEWNARKEKFRFRRKDMPVLFMAGCYRQYEGENRFVILTTQANASVSMVHERMPLILEKQEVEDWILDDQSVGFLLHKTPVLLERQTDYEQISLWDV